MCYENQKRDTNDSARQNKQHPRESRNHHRAAPGHPRAVAERTVMTLEQQCCSLPLAKRLKELGVKQESYFWWDYDNLYGFTLRSEGEWFEGHEYVGRPKEGDIAAFTVAELSDLIPGRLQIDRYSNGTWSVFWMKGTRHDEIHETHSEKADSEINAYAQTLIYLIESGLMPESLPAQKGENVI